MNRRGIEDEIRQLERDIARKEAEKAAATSVLSHSPRAPCGNSDKVARLATEIVYLTSELEKCRAEYDEVIQYIGTISNSVMRTAIRMYFVQGKPWRIVGAAVGYDESGIRRRVDKFLGRNPKVAEKS